MLMSWRQGMPTTIRRRPMQNTITKKVTERIRVLAGLRAARSTITAIPAARLVHTLWRIDLLSPLAAAQSTTALAIAGTANGSAQGTGAIPDLPVGYSRRPDGVVCQIVIDEAGTHSHEPICNYPMQAPSIQVYPIYTLNFSTVTESGRTSQIMIPTGDLSAKDSMRRCLLKQGVALKEAESKKVMEFFMSWIEKLQRTKSMVVSAAPFGWSLDSKSNVEGFVYGGNLWMPIRRPRRCQS